MHRGSIGLKSVLVLSILIIYSIAGAALALGQSDKDKDALPRPERGIAIYTEFSGVIVPPGESVRMELTADNKGKRDENISMKISEVPKGWRASLKAPNFSVDAVPVPATKTRTITFLAPNSSFNRLLNRSATVRSLYLLASWGAMGMISFPRPFLSIRGT